MRRFVLIVMMVLLPLQWSWAAAASICEHESANAHFGHHEHKHANAAVDAQDDSHAEVDDAPSGDQPADHPDCQVCHGIGAACVADADDGNAGWASDARPFAYDRHLPEPPVESFLRPPLTLVA